METNGPRTRLPSLRAAAVRFFGAPLRKQTYLNLVYLALAFPLGLLYFVFVTTGLSVSLALSILLVGVPLFVGVLAVTSLLATFERLLARYLLGVDVPASVEGDTGDDDSGTGSPTERVRGYVVSIVTDLGTWTALLYLASKLAMGVVSFVAIVTSLSVGGSLLLTPTYYDYANVTVGWTFAEPTTVTPGLKLLFGEYLVGYSFSFQLTSWEVTTLPEAYAASALGVVVLLLSMHLLNALAWLFGAYAEVMLSPTSLPGRVLDAVDV